MNDLSHELTKSDPKTDKLNSHEKKKRRFQITTKEQLLDCLNKGVYPVFLGGQIMQVYSDGQKSRITDRDELWDFCEKTAIFYYDPIIENDTLTSFFEMRFRDRLAGLLSGIDVISIGQESMSSISIFEALFDKYLDDKERLELIRILFLPDCNNEDELFFKPQGFVLNEDGTINFADSEKAALTQHFAEAQKVANLVRAEFLLFAKYTQLLKPIEETLQEGGITLVYSQDEYDQLKENPDVILHKVTKDKLHINTLLEAYAEGIDHKKVIVYFENTEKDAVPTLTPLENTNDNMVGLLNDYVGDGNSIRKLLMHRIGKKKDARTFVTHTVRETKVVMLEQHQRRHATKPMPRPQERKIA